MTVVQYEPPPPLPSSRPGDELEHGPAGDVARLRMAAEYAGYIGDSEFVPDTLRGRPAAIAAAIIAGGELGLKPMVALRTIAIIRGRPTLTAEAQRALVTSTGHELWFDETTVTRAIAAGRRAGSDRIGRITWTLDDAKRAGIAGGENWRRYPAEMLRARSSAALARAMFADVTLGIPALEEIEDEPDNGAPAIPATPPPDDAPTPPSSSRTRRRRKAEPEPEPEPERGPVQPTPPPDPQPEPPIPPEPLATDARKRQIFALMRDVGLAATGDRDERLAYTIRVIGRTIASSNELTLAEAGRVVDDLQAIKELPAEQRAARLAGAEPEPEPAEPDPLDAEQALLDAPANLAALFEEKAIGGESERLSYAGCVIGHAVATINDLIAEEAAAVIAHLKQYDRDNPQTWPFPEGF